MANVWLELVWLRQGAFKEIFSFFEYLARASLAVQPSQLSQPTIASLGWRGEFVRDASQVTGQQASKHEMCYYKILLNHSEKEKKLLLCEEIYIYWAILSWYSFYPYGKQKVNYYLNTVAQNLAEIRLIFIISPKLFFVEAKFVMEVFGKKTRAKVAACKWNQSVILHLSVGGEWAHSHGMTPPPPQNSTKWFALISIGPGSATYSWAINRGTI